MRGAGSANAWHALFTSGLQPQDLESLTDFDDNPAPPQAVTAVIEDGATPQWVDLPTFISYLEKDLRQAPRALLGPTMPLIPKMKNLWGAGLGGTAAPPFVLASMLLQALIGTDDTVEFFSESWPLRLSFSIRELTGTMKKIPCR